MEFKETPLTGEHLELNAFRDEICQLKKEEESGKTAHFLEMDPYLLTEKDLEIWNKFKDQTLTREEFDEYRQSVDKNSRYFMGFIANKIGSWELWPPRREKREK